MKVRINGCIDIECESAAILSDDSSEKIGGPSVSVREFDPVWDQGRLREIACITADVHYVQLPVDPRRGCANYPLVLETVPVVVRDSGLYRVQSASPCDPYDYVLKLPGYKLLNEHCRTHTMNGTLCQRLSDLKITINGKPIN